MSYEEIRRRSVKIADMEDEIKDMEDELKRKQDELNQEEALLKREQVKLCKHRQGDYCRHFRELTSDADCSDCMNTYDIFESVVK